MFKKKFNLEGKNILVLGVWSYWLYAVMECWI